MDPAGGGAIGALTHVVIHRLDITAANDLPRTADDAATTAVLAALTTGGVSEPFGRSTSGLRLRATDLDFSVGEGDVQVLEATAADLLLALSGRDRPSLAVPHPAQGGGQVG